MPGDRDRDGLVRGGLVGVKKPLMEAAPVTDPAAERTVLPPEVTDPQPAPANRPDEPTKPATFHLPLPLLQRLRATCRLKNTTMVDFVRQAIEDALERQRPTEAEIRKLLGM
jgi:hypothetical protein